MVARSEIADKMRAGRLVAGNELWERLLDAIEQGQIHAKVTPAHDCTVLIAYEVVMLLAKLARADNQESIWKVLHPT